MNIIQKFLLKINRPTDYVHHKQTIDFEKIVNFDKDKLPLNLLQNKTDISFKHSGNSGDIIYALPTILGVNPEHTSNLFLQINQRGFYKDAHPLGNVMLNEKMVEMLMPLLKSQKYLNEVTIYNNQKIDYDLDLLREVPFLLDRGDISRWYFHIFNVFYDLSMPWLAVEPDTTYQEFIILARSERYHNPHISYEFLKKYQKILFLGVEKEYNLMKKEIPQLEWKPVNDFLEMAQIIAGGKFFIGNQSFPYAIAEAMKVKRILEVCFYCPNVVIHGKDGYDFYFQKNFEQLVEKLNGN
jgi:hypothetical protein